MDLRKVKTDPGNMYHVLCCIRNYFFFCAAIYDNNEDISRRANVCIFGCAHIFSTRPISMEAQLRRTQWLLAPRDVDEIYTTHT